VSRQLVIFHVDGRRFALDLFAVERVTRAVLVTSLPNAPAGVIGVINMQGQLLPVLDLRRLWSAGAEQGEDEIDDIGLNDEFIVVRRTGAPDGEAPRPFALWVQSVEGVRPYEPHEWVALDEIYEKDPGVPRYFEGAVKLCGEIVLVCEPESLLDPEAELAEIITS
jgi:purine-binding chemotaxis protein CheW